MNVIKLAELSGVSKSTVYRALNGEKIKECTKKRILSVMKENNMSEAFPGLCNESRQCVRLVAFVTDKADKAGASPLEEMIKDKFSSAGFTVIDVPSEPLTSNTAEAQKLLNGVNFHSYIFVGSAAVLSCRGFIAKAAEKRPVILINASLEGKNIYSITTDVGRVTKTVMSKLINSLGHKKILYCISSRSSYANALSHEFENGVRGCGLGFSSYSVARCLDGGEAEIIRTISDSLRRDPTITSIITQDDLTASCAVKAAEALGLKVPEDISVLGYQCNERSISAAAGISCINTKTETLSDMALMLTVSVMNGRTVARKIEVPCSYIERKTVAKAKVHKAKVISAAVFDSSFISA